MEPPGPELVALRRAQLATAESEVEMASQRLQAVTLTAPISGIVTGVRVKAGDDVERGGVAMTVVDLTTVEVRGALGEADVLQVQAGDPANVLVHALPGRSLTGTISHVSPLRNGQPGAATYDVRIRVEAPQGAVLLSGLTADAEVVLHTEPDVLLIPLQGLQQGTGQPMVLAWEKGAMVEKPVTSGSSDGVWVVVESGLSEGDVIVVEGMERALTSESGDSPPVRVERDGN